MITIINKVELEADNNLLYTEIAYTTNHDIINYINIDFDNSLGKFVGENRTNLELGNVNLCPFFEKVSFVYQARTLVSSLEGRELKEITNLNQL
tara:strand:+ start:72 stop:353 length:282 start_codon:yes stop_codon:yes gene_type:complete